ncbi:restriction endonuclease subunit S [Coleofasciculus sp. E1-EBD-02]|uniref:restriction endonuclease subunit S n=1 Tax=Coleofasciculus sp. E1-EBD-02 TaxID=3068481 RepID=UPI0032F96115
MSEWLQVPLGDFADVQNGYAFKSTRFSDQGTPVIKIKNIASGEITWDEISFFSGSPQGLEKFLIHQGDVLIAMTGSHVTQVSSAVGKVARYNSDIEALLNQRVGKVYPKNLRKLDNEFLYYFLVQPVTQYKLGIGASGSANQANISPSQIKDLLIDLPPITEQKKIAAVLSSLDRKIENLRRQNETLEAIAQTLFKHWFVDFEFPNADGKPYKSSGGAMEPSELGAIPAGWRVHKLGDIVEKANTGADAIQKAPIVERNTGIKCLRVGDLTNHRPFEDWGYCEVTEKNFEQYRLRTNDIIVSRTSSLGLNLLIMSDLPSVFNNGLIRLKLNENTSHLLVFCFLQSRRFREHIEKITYETSTRPNMKINYLLDFLILHTDKVLEKKFTKIVLSLFLKVENNKKQIQTLTKTRDILLPKLMSGQIRIGG